jgi:hypothetical protein
VIQLCPGGAHVEHGAGSPDDKRPNVPDPRTRVNDRRRLTHELELSGRFVNSSGFGARSTVCSDTIGHSSAASTRTIASADSEQRMAIGD